MNDDAPTEIEETAPDPPGQIQGIRRNLAFAALSGGAACFVMVLIWVLVASTTGAKSGWMAIILGLVIGGATRFSGQSGDSRNGLAAVIWTFVGWIAGAFIGVCAVAAKTAEISFTEVLTKNDITSLLSIVQAHFQFTDFIFCAIAICAAYMLGLSGAGARHSLDME